MKQKIISTKNYENMIKTDEKHDKIEEELYKILNDPEKLQKMKINARLLAKKNSTRDICETLLEKL